MGKMRKAKGAGDFLGAGRGDVAREDLFSDVT